MFQNLGQNPGAWVLSAERLKKSAGILRVSEWPVKRKWHDQEVALSDFTIGPVFMMLIGMAVENVLKAMLVAAEPDAVEAQRLSKGFKTHDLFSLWDRAGLRRSDSYDRLLKRLQGFVEAFGRYPVTSSKDRMPSMVGALFHEGDSGRSDQLWDFLRRKLFERCPETDPAYGNGRTEGCASKSPQLDADKSADFPNDTRQS